MLLKFRVHSHFAHLVQSSTVLISLFVYVERRKFALPLAAINILGVWSVVYIVLKNLFGHTALKED